MKIFSIRPAQQKDIKALIPLQRKMVKYHHGLDPATWKTGKEDEGIWKSMLTGFLKDTKNYSFLVLECNGKAVGFATAEIRATSSAYKDKKLGYIASIFVDTSARRQGLASMAVEHFMEWFAKNDVTTVTLNVEIKNSLAVTAWHKLGFEEWRLTLRKSIAD